MNFAIQTVLLLVVYVAMSSGGLVLFKLAPTFLSAQFIVGFGLYGAGFLIWYALLKALPLSVAFPLAAGSLIIATQLAGRLFLHEPLTGLHIAGVIVLLAGLGIIGFARAY